MTRPILVLQLPSQDFRSMRVLAATRDPSAIKAFLRVVYRELDERVETAEDDPARRVAEMERAQRKALLEFALEGAGHAAREDSPPGRLAHGEATPC